MDQSGISPGRGAASRPPRRCDDGGMPQTPEQDLTAALPSATREIEEFVAAAGWDQPTQVFALVPTERLLAAEPGLADQLDPASALTPIAQDALPAEDLAEALGRIEWPEQVAGCALVQDVQQARHMCLHQNH